MSSMMLSGYAQRGPAPNQEINAYGMRSRTVYPPNASPSAYGFDSGRAQATVALRQPNALRQNVPLLHPVIRPNDVVLLFSSKIAEGLALPSGTPLAVFGQPIKAKTESTNPYGMREKYNPDLVYALMLDIEEPDNEEKAGNYVKNILLKHGKSDEQMEEFFGKKAGPTCIAFTMGKSPFTYNPDGFLQGNIALVTRGPTEYRFKDSERKEFIKDVLTEGDDIFFDFKTKIFKKMLQEHKGGDLSFVARVTEAPQYQTGVLHIEIIMNHAELREKMDVGKGTEQY